MKNFLIIALFTLGIFSTVKADEILPRDNSIVTYHTAPRYRASEEHPLRLVAYVAHPVGWIARELITRPLSSAVSSTAFTRSFFGYREPGDFRQPSCFSASNATPDCRSVPPFNYERPALAEEIPAGAMNTKTVNQVTFPNVNFDFNSRKLNDSGLEKVKQIAKILEDESSLIVVLEGHTDFICSDAYNNTLGLDRAETVRKALLDLGITPERLSTVSFGKTRPLIDEKTDAARAANRRVEAHQDTGETAK